MPLFSCEGEEVVGGRGGEEEEDDEGKGTMLFVTTTVGREEAGERIFASLSTTLFLVLDRLRDEDAAVEDSSTALVVLT